MARGRRRHGGGGVPLRSPFLLSYRNPANRVSRRRRSVARPRPRVPLSQGLSSLPLASGCTLLCFASSLGTCLGLGLASFAGRMPLTSCATLSCRRSCCTRCALAMLRFARRSRKVGLGPRRNPLVYVVVVALVLGILGLAPARGEISTGRHGGCIFCGVCVCRGGGGGGGGWGSTRRAGEG